MKLLSRVRLFATPWTVAHQAPLSMGFSRQEYWSGLPFPSPGDLSNPGIEPRSPALQADALTSNFSYSQQIIDLVIAFILSWSIFCFKFLFSHNTPESTNHLLCLYCPVTLFNAVPCFTSVSKMCLIPCGTTPVPSAY